jgi:hypothetical protein
MVQAISRFQRLTEQWQASLGLNDTEFSAFLERPKQEWHFYRSGERDPSRRFISRVLRKAPEPWKSALENAHLADLQDTSIPA